jgi:hypothetical protein
MYGCSCDTVRTESTQAQCQYLTFPDAGPLQSVSLRTSIMKRLNLRPEKLQITYINLDRTIILQYTQPYFMSVFGKMINSTAVCKIDCLSSYLPPVHSY